MAGIRPTAAAPVVGETVLDRPLGVKAQKDLTKAEQAIDVAKKEQASFIAENDQRAQDLLMSDLRSAATAENVARQRAAPVATPTAPVAQGIAAAETAQTARGGAGIAGGGRTETVVRKEKVEVEFSLGARNVGDGKVELDLKPTIREVERETHVQGDG